MITKINEQQKKALEAGLLKAIILPKKDYKKNGKIHLATELGPNYTKAGIKTYSKIKEVFIDPKHSDNSAIIDVDYLTLTNSEKKEFAIDCGFESTSKLLENYPKNVYSLITFD